MSDKLVFDFPTPGLEYVFQPPGLLLATKTPDQPATTSILIRGGAGTGKTTLAVSMAHAIAREQGGHALYLTTEFVPTELAYKATTLGLGEGMVTAWARPGARTLPPGAVLVEHLLRTQAGEQVETTSDRKHAAIEAVREILDGHDAEEQEGTPAPKPVRAVVIVAFGLPDLEVEGADRTLRAELLALIQSLEVEGISTILIEEAISRSESWLPFVVDIVLQLELSPDPDTGELLRRLTCPKSRYRPAFPGPHVYGLAGGHPTLWPDILPEGPHGLWREPLPEAAPPIFLPIGSSDYAICTPGTLLLSNYKEQEVLPLILHATTGALLAWVKCGPVTTIASDAASTLLSIQESHGPFAIAWALLRLQRQGRVNTVVFHNLEYFWARPRLGNAAFRMLGLLKAGGLSVCIHGQNEELRRLAPVVDLDGRRTIRRDLLRVPPQRSVRSSVRWLHFLPHERTSPDPMAHTLFSMWLSGASMRDLVASQRVADVPVPITKSIQAAERIAVHHLLGDEMRMDAELGKLSRESGSPSVAVAFLALMVTDRVLEAAHLAVDANMSSANEKFASLFWPLFETLYTFNEKALAIVRRRAMEEEDIIAVVFLLRAMASRGRVAEAMKMAKDYSWAVNPPAWFFLRLHADLLLEAADGKDAEEAVRRLDALKEDDLIPPLHRAEIFYNLGIAHEQLRHYNTARAAYRSALDINPGLQVAQTALSEIIEA